MLYATEGTKSILDGNYDDSRIFANAVKYVEVSSITGKNKDKVESVQELLWIALKCLN